MQEFLPGVRANVIAEQRLVGTPLRPVRARINFGGPAGGQIWSVGAVKILRKHVERTQREDVRN